MGFKTKTEAEEDLKKWKATMPKQGKGWKSRVWENLGWHWSLMLGPISVYRASGSRDGNPQFHTLIAGDVTESGHGSCKWTASGDDGTFADSPYESVQKGVRNYRKYAESERAMLARMDEFFTDANL